ncbi:hypothetical protein CJU89_4756 [Yarrowia sp. B02]|nr:hypothetical protein CJU89_4756 [Yarrowia sp. B02]
MPAGKAVPAHHEAGKVKGAVDEIVTGSLIGGVQGGIFGAASHFLAKMYWPHYSKLTKQFKLFLQLSCVITGGVYAADKRLIRYEHKLRIDQRALIAERAAAAEARGEYIDHDGNVRDASGKVIRQK